MNVLGAVLVFSSLLLSSVSVSASAAEEANSVVERWAATFTANDGVALVKLYAPDATVLGTVSPTLAEDEQAIRAYFSTLRPGGTAKVVLGERRTVVLGDAAVLVTGFYEFSRMRDGQPVVTPARFSFVVVKRAQGWVIGHHHSSQRPKPPQ